MANAVTHDTLLYVLRWGEEDFTASSQVPAGFSEVSLNVGETPNVQPDRHNGVTAGAFVTLTAPQQDAADADYGTLGEGGVVAQNLPRFATESGALEDSGTPGTFVASSAGVGDAGKPVVLDGAGQLDSSLGGGVSAHSALSGLPAPADDHTQYQLRSEQDAASGYVGLTAGSKISNGAFQVYGTGANTACEGNDTRLPTQDENDALTGTGTPSGSNVFVTDDDARLTELQSPVPADEEIILGTGTAATIRGGKIRLNEIGSTGVIGDPEDIVQPDPPPATTATNVKITAHTAYFKETAALLAKIVRVDVAEIAGIAIPLNSVKLVGVDFNGGTPIAIVADQGTPGAFNLLTQQPLAQVSRDAEGIHITDIVIPLTDIIARQTFRIVETELLAYVSGLIIGTSGVGDDKVTMSEGRVYVLFLPQTYTALDTNVSGTFDLFTGSTAIAFGAQQNLTDYPADEFNDLTATPGTLNNNRFGTIWWYLDVDNGGVMGMLGTSNATSLAEAGAELAPSDLPPRIVSSGILLGRYVITKDDHSVTIVESTFLTGEFATEGVTVHSSLSGLLADDHIQYLLINGSRAMTGGLDMGTNAITNVGNVDGVDVSDHNVRHEDGGADAIEGAALETTITPAPTNYTPTANTLKGQLDGIDAALGATGGGGIQGNKWKFSTTITDADPGAGNFRLNNATQPSATQVFISDFADNGADVSSILLGIQPNDQLYIEQSSSATNFQLYTVTGDPVDATGYVKIPILSVDAGTDLQDTEECSILKDEGPSSVGITEIQTGLLSASAAVPIGGTPTTVPMDFSAVTFDPAVFTFTPLDTDVTVNVSGRYRIFLESSVMSTSAGASTILGEIWDGGAPILEAQAQTDVENSTVVHNGLTVERYADLTGGAVIGPRFTQTAGSGSASVDPGGMRMSITFHAGSIPGAVARKTDFGVAVTAPHAIDTNSGSPWKESGAGQVTEIELVALLDTEAASGSFTVEFFFGPDGGPYTSLGSVSILQGTLSATLVLGSPVAYPAGTTFKVDRLAIGAFPGGTATEKTRLTATFRVDRD